MPANSDLARQTLKGPMIPNFWYFVWFPITCVGETWKLLLTDRVKVMEGHDYELVIMFMLHKCVALVLLDSLSP